MCKKRKVYIMSELNLAVRSNDRRSDGLDAFALWGASPPYRDRSRCFPALLFLKLSKLNNPFVFC